jgi:putative transposase
VARQLPLVEPGLAFHITARGNYRQTVFYTDLDRAEYLNLLAEHAGLESLEVLGWCLMTNHIHLLAIPRKPASLARTMMRTQAGYAQAVNRRHGSRCGHLWQSRFYSCPLAGDAIWTVLRYVELNPVRAHLVTLADHSPWSSAAFHCGSRSAPPLLSLTEWKSLWTPERWRVVLVHGPDERELGAIREATQHGLPFGNQEFITDLERRCGRPLALRSVGRPRLAPATLPTSSGAGIA